MAEQRALLGNDLAASEGLGMGVALGGDRDRLGHFPDRLRRGFRRAEHVQ